MPVKNVNILIIAGIYQNRRMIKMEWIEIIRIDMLWCVSK